MARSKHSTEGNPDDIREVADEVRKLREEVRVLRDVLAEIHEELQWAVRNGMPSEVTAPMRPIISLPIDPTCHDFAERVNAVPAEQLDALTREATSQTPAQQKAAANQRQLFD